MIRGDDIFDLSGHGHLIERALRFTGAAKVEPQAGNTRFGELSREQQKQPVRFEALSGEAVQHQHGRHGLHDLKRQVQHSPEALTVDFKLDRMFV